MLSLVFSIVLTNSADAASFMPQTPAQQAAEAGIVVEGDVGESWTDYVNGTPITCWRLSVTNEFKGDAVADELVVFMPGGEYPDGSVLQFAGVPTLSEGQHVILFGAVEAQDRVRLTNFQTGMLRRVSGPGGTHVTADTGSIVLADFPGERIPTRVQRHDGDFFRASDLDTLPSDEAPGATYAADPTVLGLPWADARARTQQLVEANPAGAENVSFLRGEQ